MVSNVFSLQTLKSIRVLSSVGRLLDHNLGADKEKAGSSVLLSALEIVFGTAKEILSREWRLGREGTQ